MIQALKDGAIGILGGIELAAFRRFLPADTPEHLYRQIAGATPVNLLSRELLDRGHRLALFSLHPAIKRGLKLEGERLRIYLGPTRSLAVLNGFREERQFLVNAMRQEKPACVHAHWTYEYALAAADSGLPHLVTAHDAPINCLRRNVGLNPFGPYGPQSARQVVRGNIFWLARTSIAYRAARRTQRIVAVSPYVADHLRRWGFHRKPIEVVPNGMPAEFFTRRGREAPSKAFTFGAALGHWARLKNPAPLVTAFARVRQVLPEARMLMFGAGYAQDGPAAQWARARGWEAGIEFMGQTPHAEVMRQMSERVDVLVHPSLEEAHPMPLIEAMAFGIPIVAGRWSGGVPWTLDEGACGLLVDVRAPEAMAAAMIELAQDAAVRNRLGAAGRRRAKKEFSLGQMVDRYEGIYQQLVSAVQ